MRTLALLTDVTLLKLVGVVTHSAVRTVAMMPLRINPENLAFLDCPCIQDKFWEVADI